MHKLKGERAQEYAIWIEQNLRITLQIKDGLILLTDIITRTSTTLSLDKGLKIFYFML
jgi:plasmid maintenance system killer protein